MKQSLEMGRTQLKGHIPAGCSRIALSADPETLIYATQAGNRATRREAKRNLRKLGFYTKEKAAGQTAAFSTKQGK